MKKILIFMMLAFSVVCYATPPPVETPDFIADQVQYVVQGNQTVTVYTFEAPEVAFNYLGNFELSTCNSKYGEQVSDVVVPQATVTDINYFGLCYLKKPPEFYSNSGVINSNRTFSMNKQNSNYGYPFGADYYVS